MQLDLLHTSSVESTYVEVVVPVIRFSWSARRVHRWKYAALLFPRSSHRIQHNLICIGSEFVFKGLNWKGGLVGWMGRKSSTCERVGC